MSYLRKAKATCGRHAQKPNDKDDNVNYDDETSIPLQDQIDNLRAKISLKEKYNKALREEVSETNEGAATMIAELILQNKQLQEDLQLEKTAEKYAVKKALRSYRLFQLAVCEKDAESVINWLDDKIFDASKTLNEGIYLLKKMQNKIQDAEGQVHYLEQCPVPGSELWERRANEDQMNLECAIEARKANRDAASILNKKYKEILYILRGERGKWPHIMDNMEKTLNQLKHELSSLEVMLEDAIRFREEAREKLQLTEEEASANRKQRRSQMNKMKRSVEKALEANSSKYHHAVEPPPKSVKSRAPPGQSHMSLPTPSQAVLQKTYQEIRAKQMQVQDYEDTVLRLVEAMRVSDLRQCPKRLNTVRKVGEVLQNEISMKEELRDLLLKHKYRLQLIMQYFKYTGCEKEEQHQQKAKEKELQLEELESDERIKRSEANGDGAILSDLRYAMIGLDEMLQQGKKKAAPPSKNQELKVIMAKLLEKIRQLVDSVAALKKEFPEKTRPHRSYAPYVKYNIPARYTRVGAPDEMDVDDNSDPELDIIDSKIPSREELKQKSERFYAQALLRRGLR